MLKLIIGVVLLIIILLTSYYILVENDSIKEHFQQSCNYVNPHTVIQNNSGT